MINPKFFTKTFSELLSDLSKLKIENGNKFSEMQSEIQEHQNLIDSLQNEISECRKSQKEYKIECESMKMKMVEMEAKIKEQSKIIEIFTQKQIKNIAINAEKDFLVVGKPTTLTAKVTPSNAFNKEVEWKIIQPDEGSVEIVEKDETKLVIKGLKLGKKVIVSAASMDGSGVEAEMEIFTAYFKCEFNVNTQSNQIIKGTIQIIKVEITLDKEKSRF